jgi:hypothetical protein
MAAAATTTLSRILQQLTDQLQADARERGLIPGPKLFCGLEQRIARIQADQRRFEQQIAMHIHRKRAESKTRIGTCDSDRPAPHDPTGENAIPCMAAAYLCCAECGFLCPTCADHPCLANNGQHQWLLPEEVAKA